MLIVTQRQATRFGEQLRRPELSERLDPELLELKRALEVDLTKVICRTERNWYVMDKRQGIDEDLHESETLAGKKDPRLPAKEELKEFFLLHKALANSAAIGQLTEFWKSAPSLLTFIDGQYHIFRALKKGKIKVPRELVTTPTEVETLARRNHRISLVVDLSLGKEGKPPPLWTAPTFKYYSDDYFGQSPPRKSLVFSGWRFVPKTIAIIASRVATDRLGGDSGEVSQPIRFTEKSSFHVFDLCFPSPSLAKLGEEAFMAVRQFDHPRADDLVRLAEQILRRQLHEAGVGVVVRGGHHAWQVVMRLEQYRGHSREILNALNRIEEQEDGGTEHLFRHIDTVNEWLKSNRSDLQISERRLKRLALVSVFSPAVTLFRSCTSVFGELPTYAALPDIAALTFGPMRRYFNRPLVQNVIRKHRYRMHSRKMPSKDRGYVERALIYGGDAHLQAVLDEYVYLLRYASQADTVQKALSQIGDVWKLSRGSPRTNRPKGYGRTVHVEENAEVHATQFALAFGEDVSRDAGLDADDTKMRRSVVREAFNSPFWPFVLATTSVGQEGLDFHLYCRDVVHWNLPSNPVDLEQREGRVNRRDCLAIRESIAQDCPLDRGALSGTGNKLARNPWPMLFDSIEHSKDIQKYKHGLFPHWVYECRDPARTIRIRRHVPFFSTSRDALKYERVKRGLALYRLVFGQINQEDLLETLQQQTAGLDPETENAKLKRLRSYMLNLSPIGHKGAKKIAWDEAKDLLNRDTEHAALRELLRAVHALQTEWPDSLGEVEEMINGLVRLVEAAIASGNLRSTKTRIAVAALAYLRNPYDHIFDLHVESGFMDDVVVIREAWASLHRPNKRLGRRAKAAVE